MPIKILLKLISSALSGVVCSLLVPLSIYLIDLLSKTLYPQSWEAWGYFTLLLLVAVVIPASAACSGLVSLAAGSRLGLAKWDHIVLPEISGIMSAVSGLTLAGFPVSITPCLIMIIAYSQCSLIGIALYFLVSGKYLRQKTW